MCIEPATRRGLETLLERLPQGMATRLHGAQTLSQGEAARVRLARAVLGRPRLLLLDEIETGMDGEARQRLEMLLANYRGTVIYATHDAALAALAHEQWQLTDGRLSVVAADCSKAAA